MKNEELFRKIVRDLRAVDGSREDEAALFIGVANERIEFVLKGKAVHAALVACAAIHEGFRRMSLATAELLRDESFLDKFRQELRQGGLGVNIVYGKQDEAEP